MNNEKSPKPARKGTLIEISRSLPGDPSASDCPDLMGYPFFSLGEARRLMPIRYHTLGVTIAVEGTSDQGIATIWDADILIWAASQILKAQRERTGTSRLLVARTAEILEFIHREPTVENHDRLKWALDRLQSTTISTSVRQTEGRRRHRFSWIAEWKEHAAAKGSAAQMTILMPDWLYLGLLAGTVRLPSDPTYFKLQGGLVRWLYRVIRLSRHRVGELEFLHLYGRSGTLEWPADFARHLRRLASEQSLPGYELGVTRGTAGQEILTFAPRDPVQPKSAPAPQDSARDPNAEPG